KTNNFGMELYCFQAEVNSTEFPLAYLFLENNRKTSSFNPLSEFGARFPFDSIVQSPKFCPKEYQETIWKMIEKHLHQHPLIPTYDGQFITGELIWKTAIQEAYSF
ncbi:10980_t:CDS:2, partial [Scutellospora calospora]